MRQFCTCYELATQKRPRDCRDIREEKTETLALSVTVINVTLSQFMLLELVKAQPSPYASKTTEESAKRKAKDQWQSWQIKTRRPEGQRTGSL